MRMSLSRVQCCSLRPTPVPIHDSRPVAPAKLSAGPFRCTQSPVSRDVHPDAASLVRYQELLAQGGEGCLSGSQLCADLRARGTLGRPQLGDRRLVPRLQDGRIEIDGLARPAGARDECADDTAEGEAGPVAEAPIDGPLADAGLAGDVVHRHAVHAALGDQALGRLEHQLPVASRVGTLPNGGRRGVEY